MIESISFNLEVNWYMEKAVVVRKPLRHNFYS